MANSSQDAAWSPSLFSPSPCILETHLLLLGVCLIKAVGMFTIVLCIISPCKLKGSGVLRFLNIISASSVTLLLNSVHYNVLCEHVKI